MNLLVLEKIYQACLCSFILLRARYFAQTITSCKDLLIAKKLEMTFYSIMGSISHLGKMARTSAKSEIPDELRSWEINVLGLLKSLCFSVALWQEILSLIHVAETDVEKSERAGAIDCHVTYSCTMDAVRLKTLSRNIIFTLSVIEEVD